MPRKPERGAALIVALLVVALVAGIAAAAVNNLGIAFAGVSDRHDRAQARQLARGAVEWARNVLAEDARTSAVDHLHEEWAIKVPPTPVEEGEVSGELLDYSGRFNLNNLLRGGTASEADIAAFVRLLQLLGLPENEARARADALVDWIDADQASRSSGGAEAEWYAAQNPPRRPPNAPLADVGELAQIRGFTPQLVGLLRPLVAALPPGSLLNVNTAPPEVLAATIDGLGLDAARRLVADRERAWYKDKADFAARLPKSVNLPDNVMLSTSSRYFLAVGRARYGVSAVNMEVLLDRKQQWSDIIWQRQL